MIKHYSKEGNPITFDEWAKLFENFEYKRVGLDFVGDKRVSTIWLGMDHSWDESEILIFETMVFSSDSSDEEDMDRYSTLEQAVAGHKRFVDKLKLEDSLKGESK